MSSVNTWSKVKLFYQSKISLWLKSRAAPARNYYNKTSWESLHCCTLHSMTPPAEPETPPPLLHRSPSPLPSNTITLLIVLSFRMLSRHFAPSHLHLFTLTFFRILHHLFSFCLPPSAPGLSYSTVFCLRGASHTKPIKLNLDAWHCSTAGTITEPLYRRGVSAWSECNGFMVFFTGFLNTTVALLAPSIQTLSACGRSTLWECLPSLLMVCVYGTIHTNPGFLSLRSWWMSWVYNPMCSNMSREPGTSLFPPPSFCRCACNKKKSFDKNPTRWLQI